MAPGLIDFDRAELKTHYCIDLTTRDAQVAWNVERVKARIEPGEPREDRLAIACYGPSLLDTWEQLRGYRYIISCSGAHRFLLERGIVPTWHAECDPREHKAGLIGPPHKDVEYLVASCCHPGVVEHLQGFNVKLWHVFTNESARTDLAETFPRGEWVLTGGSNVGLRAMVIGRFLGFRRQDVFGMDYSFLGDGRQHAGEHPKEGSQFCVVECEGRRFLTNAAMVTYARQFFTEVSQIPDLDMRVFGVGLLQAKIHERMQTGPIQAVSGTPVIAMQSERTISEEYVKANRELHETNEQYGTSSGRRVGTVKSLIDNLKPQTVLDYGCGKGLLAKNLSIPIWEYDPAIPGKDSPPRPADLVVCTDVLEHIEPEYLDAVLRDLARVTLKTGYFVICTGPAGKTLPDGRNAHLIQQPREWWEAKLAEHFSIGKFLSEDGNRNLHVVVGRKGEKKASKGAICEVKKGPHKARFFCPNEATTWRAETLFTKEPVTIDWLESMNRGEVLLDVGANVGMYSVWAGVHGVKTYAFEPEADNYSVLVKNLAMNGLDASTAYCAALTDKPGMDTLYLSSPGAGGSCHSYGASVKFDLRERPEGVKQGCIGMTVDSLGVRPNHIKIDVDGFEHKVIQGAGNTLPWVDSLLIEVNPNIPEHVAMMGELERQGFEYDREQWESAKRTEGTFKGVGECVFRRVSAEEKRLIGLIECATMQSHPFPHLVIDGVWSDEFYKALRDNLPAEYPSINDTGRVKGNYDNRGMVWPETQFWNKFRTWMLSGAVRRAMLKRFGVKGSHQEVKLMRDTPGYEISPHTDSRSKALTALFYLPADESNGAFGTSLYTLKAGESVQDDTHHGWEKFERSHTIKFLPNRVFIFARTNESFHGCETFTGDGVRDILLYDVRV